MSNLKLLYNSCCPQCKQSFICGRSNPAGCWCSKVQLFLPVPSEGSKCLCPKCLSAKISQHIRGPISPNLHAQVAPWYSLEVKIVNQFNSRKDKSETYRDPCDNLNQLSKFIQEYGSPQDIKLFKVLLYAFGLVSFRDSTVHGPHLLPGDIVKIYAILLDRLDPILETQVALLTDPRDLTPPLLYTGGKIDHIYAKQDQVPVNLLFLIKEAEVLQDLSFDSYFIDYLSDEVIRVKSYHPHTESSKVILELYKDTEKEKCIPFGETSPLPGTLMSYIEEMAKIATVVHDIGEAPKNFN